jgi:hypothetical protein
MSEFVCPIHGVFKPDMVFYSCPLQAKCPTCGVLIYEKQTIEHSHGEIGVCFQGEQPRLRYRSQVVPRNMFGGGTETVKILQECVNGQWIDVPTVEGV